MVQKSRPRRCAIGLAAAMAFGGVAFAADQEPQPGRQAPAPASAPPAPEGRGQEIRSRTGEIVTQPARDVGISKRPIPPVLVKALEDPYSLKGLKGCKQLAAAIKELNVELGPDFKTGNERTENRAGRIAEAGGKTVINSIIPFRSLVREISGAAPAQRRMNDAVDAGFARRGYLRGVHSARSCRTTF